MLTDYQIKSIILEKLYRKGKWGGAHTASDNIKRWILPRNLGKNGGRIDRAMKELIKDGWIILKPTHYGEQISLNPRFKGQIEEWIQAHYPK
jgi:hypothetical protein